MATVSYKCFCQRYPTNLLFKLLWPGAYCKTLIFGGILFGAISGLNKKNAKIWEHK